MCVTIFWKEKMAFLDYKNQVFKKVENLGFFQTGWSMGLVKKLKKKLYFSFR